MNLPLYQLDSEPTLADEGNQGLWYSRFFNRYQADWTIADEGKRDWVSDNARLTGQGQRENLNAYVLRHLALITALDGRGAVFKTDWHFATGLGLPHPVENGLTWHHTLGVPYLAGSAVKGLIRAWVEVWDESLDKTEKDRIVHWFGDQQQAGCFRFFDALPVDPVTLIADVMTPHMDKWYEQGGAIQNWQQEPEKVPADWHAPVPVPFLAVKEAKLLFGIAPRRPEFAAELPQVFDALKQALDWLGAGAKTAAGYGRMVEDATRFNRLAEKAAEAAKQAKFAQLSPEQQALQTLRERFEVDQKRGIKEPGGELIDDINQLLKDGLAWSPTDREALAQLAEAIFGYVGWGKKKAERKEKIAALRE